MASHVDAQTAGSCPTLLLIEDDVTFARYLLERLRRLGFDADWLADGARARTRLQQRPTDLLVVDLALPRADGLTLIAELKQARLLEATAVVVLTGRFSAADVDRATQLGVDEYVSKPFNEAAVFERLAALANRRPDALQPTRLS
jgi:DNA-binding response OmpR family regulator